MSDRRHQPRSVLFQIAAGIALAGLLAFAITAVVQALLLRDSLVQRQMAQESAQIDALSNCAARVSVPLLVARGKRLNRLLDAALAGTPQRSMIVINQDGALRYASALPAPELRTLLGRLRHDVRAAAGPRGASTIHSDSTGGIILADATVSCSTGVPGTARPVGILIAESQAEVTSQWLGLMGSLLLAVLAGLGVLVLLGSAVALSVAKPLRAAGAAARLLAAGGQRRLAPSGPVEVRELGAAFNALADEAARRERVDHDLLANISHELAGPLGLIQGYAEALSDGVIDGTNARREALHAIGREAERLKSLTGDLLDLALLETGDVSPQWEEVPLAELLTNLAARLGPAAARQGVSLCVDLPESLPAVYTDGSRLEQVLINLLTNALRHTPEGGSVTMSARPAAAGVNLAVTDTGVGIPPEDLARIWERFYQVDKGRDRRSNSGLGLGLAIARSTVTLLGGRIDVESAVGSGTTFRIWLPLDPRNV